jgi:hypothetical protein
MKKDVAIGRFSGYSLPMSSLPFPADSAEYEEYCNVMNAMADEAEASTPDPEPEDFGGRCEDAPCCGCCGNEAYESAMEYERQREERFNDEPSGWSPDEESDDLHAREEDDHYASMHECEFEPEDRYLDSQWEDANEYGMDGCCGDF